MRKGTPGYRTEKIENKIALRCVQVGTAVLFIFVRVTECKVWNCHLNYFLTPFPPFSWLQNADMTFERCFVSDSARLPGVDSFKDTNKVLAISR